MDEGGGRSPQRPSRAVRPRDSTGLPATKAQNCTSTPPEAQDGRRSHPKPKHPKRQQPAAANTTNITTTKHRHLEQRPRTRRCTTLHNRTREGKRADPPPAPSVLVR